MRKDVLVHARIDRHTHRQLKNLSKKRGKNISETLRNLIENQLRLLNKTPDEIRFDILMDDRKRYIKELQLEGFRVIDISKIIYDELGVAREPWIPELNYIMIMDKDRVKIWIEMPPPIICKGTFQLITSEGIKSFDLYGDVFKLEDFDKKDIEIKEKLINFIESQKEHGTLDLFLEPEPKYLQLYKLTGAEIRLVRKSKFGLEIKEDIKGKSKAEALDRALIEIKDVLLRDKYGPRTTLGILNFGVLRDKLWCILPDKYSGENISTFTPEEEKNFRRFLTIAWGLFFNPNPERAINGDVIMMKLPEHIAKSIDDAIKTGIVKSADEAVYSAIQGWCDKWKEKKTVNISVSKSRPAIKKALAEGYYKNPREAVEEALSLLERRLSR